MIQAKIVADSTMDKGHRLTTMLITLPRIILAELNTHRMLSKNTSSSRAIPFNKMVEAVQNNPFIPIAWQKDHKGMQGTEYLTDEHDIEVSLLGWLEAKEEAVDKAIYLSNCGVTKQICNRLLEPFMWTTVLISGTEWENFFSLRCPQYTVKWEDKEIVYRSKKDFIIAEGEHHKNHSDLEWLGINKGQAEIHMMALAEAMWDAYNESTPKQLKAGEWHIPFEDKIDNDKLEEVLHGPYRASYIRHDGDKEQAKVEISTAMCARTSYTVIGEEKEINYESLLSLTDRMINQVPFHASPFEHCARVMDNEEYNNLVSTTYNVKDDTVKTVKGSNKNFRGFIQYRTILEQ